MSTTQKPLKLVSADLNTSESRVFAPTAIQVNITTATPTDVCANLDTLKNKVSVSRFVLLNLLTSTVCAFAKTDSLLLMVYADLPRCVLFTVTITRKLTVAFVMLDTESSTADAPVTNTVVSMATSSTDNATAMTDISGFWELAEDAALMRLTTVLLVSAGSDTTEIQMETVSSATSDLTVMTTKDMMIT